MLSMQFEVLKQLFRRAITNRFPSKRVPSSVTGFLRGLEKGKVKVNPPVQTPEGFRGRVKYDKKRCIGCRLCTTVCPSQAVVFHEKEKKISYHLFRCTFCGECVAICPVKALLFTNEFLLADYKTD